MYSVKLLGGACIESSAGPFGGRAAQRHRLALVALLATAPSRRVSRDKLIAWLWPDANAERGRHLLSDSVYRLNKALDEKLIAAAGDDLHLTPRRTSIDVLEFQEALAGEDWERAAGLYSGPFLDGFFLSDAAEFEQWGAVKREHLDRQYARALETLAKCAQTDGDRGQAVRWWYELIAHDPCSSRIALGLMQALDADGEQSAALEQARKHTALVRQEFGVEPDPQIAALAARLCSKRAAGGAGLKTGVAARTVPVLAGIAGEPPPAPAQAAGSNAAPNPGSAARTPAHGTAAGWNFSRRLTLGALFALPLAVGTWLFWPSPAVVPDDMQPAIAVLPFVNISPGAGNRYFSDGITEELINVLSQVDGLSVTARTSSFAFQGENMDVREIGRQLNVATILEGAVRKSGDQLLISAQLIDTETGFHLWSHTYERQMADVFAIQEEIARAIVETLKVKLVGDEAEAIVRRPTENLEAYNLYLRGRYFWHQRTALGLKQSVRFFARASELAPDYALAWAGLADAYSVLAFYDYLPPDEAYPKARAAARQALAIDDTLAAAHASLGYIALYYDWDLDRAEAEFRRAISLDPASSVAHQWYANHLTASGRFAEAAREMSRARDENPLSLIANGALGWVYYYAGRYKDAVAQCDRALEMEPDWDLGYLWRGQALEESGRLDAAIQSFQRAVALSGGSGITVAALAHAYAVSGDRARTMELLAELNAANRGGQYVPAFEIAKVHLALGDTDEALQWLERAYRQHSHSMAFLKVDPQLASLQANARFLRLVDKVGL